MDKRLIATALNDIICTTNVVGQTGRNQNGQRLESDNENADMFQNWQIVVEGFD